MIERDWEGQDVVLIASGPSLTEDQIEVIRPYHTANKIKVAGCNDAYRIYPDLDLLYAADQNWWQHHISKIKELNIPKLCIPNEKFATANEITFIKGAGGKKLSTNSNCISYGGNSGFQLFNIAFLKGVKKIILLGYDYTYNKKAHWFGDHKSGMRNPPKNMGNWVSSYSNSQELLKEIEVINCSEISIIECFPKMTIEEALNV